jgi:putative adhesin
MKIQIQQSKSRVFAAPLAIAVLAIAAPFVFGQQKSAGSAADTADRVTVNLSDPTRPASLKASLLNGSIFVKGYDGKEILVEAHVRSGSMRGRRRSEEPEDAGEQADKDESDSARPSTRGMRRLQVAATGLTVEEENNQVRVSTESVNRSIDLMISVPRQTSLVLHTVNGGNIEVSGVTGDVDVNDINGSVKLEHISGSAIAHALNGEVHVVFDRITQKPMAFSSMNGTIDVTFPPDLKANLTIKSDRGDVFSDFDVQLQAGAPHQIVEDGRAHGGAYRVKIDKTIHGTIGGGGPEIQFNNFNGSIYIRKAGAAHE